jgi:hypothetical protein
MARVRVHNFTVSLDGYGAGPLQTREVPLGVGGEALHEWFVPTRAFQRINGKTGGTTGADDDIAARFGVASARGSWDATCSAIRGPWLDDAWRDSLERTRRTSIDICVDASRPPADPDGRRHGVPLCHGRYP